MPNPPFLYDHDGHERASYSRFREVEARYRNTGAGTRSILFALAASLVLGALIMFYHRDANVSSRLTGDGNTGQISPRAFPHGK
jgi:hypothetical protein